MQAQQAGVNRDNERREEPIRDDAGDRARARLRYFHIRSGTCSICINVLSRNHRSTSCYYSLQDAPPYNAGPIRNLQDGRQPTQLNVTPKAPPARRVRPAGPQQSRRTTGKPPAAPTKANRASRRLSDGIQLHSKAPRLQREARRACGGADAASSSRTLMRAAAAPRASAGAAQSWDSEGARGACMIGGGDWQPTSRSGLMVR